jgi:hypothetical protein
MRQCKSPKGILGPRQSKLTCFLPEDPPQRRNERLRQPTPKKEGTWRRARRCANCGKGPVIQGASSAMHTGVKSSSGGKINIHE